MVLLYILLIIIILGGAIYNSRRERFTCKNSFKRLRVDNNGKSKYMFLSIDYRHNSVGSRTRQNKTFVPKSLY